MGAKWTDRLDGKLSQPRKEAKELEAMLMLEAPLRGMGWMGHEAWEKES